MRRIYGNIGFVGLWNGLPVRILMIGTLTVDSKPLTQRVIEAHRHTGFPMAHLR